MRASRIDRATVIVGRLTLSRIIRLDFRTSRSGNLCHVGDQEDSARATLTSVRLLVILGSLESRRTTLGMNAFAIHGGVNDVLCYRSCPLGCGGRFSHSPL